MNGARKWKSYIGSKEFYFFFYLCRINLKDTVRSYRKYGLRNFFTIEGFDADFIFSGGKNIV